MEDAQAEVLRGHIGTGWVFCFRQQRREKKGKRSAQDYIVIKERLDESVIGEKCLDFLAVQAFFWVGGFSKSDRWLLQVRYAAALGPCLRAVLSPCFGCSGSESGAALGPCSASS